jgi:DNA-binding LacI/PurR family transcriptional regulator
MKVMARLIEDARRDGLGADSALPSVRALASRYAVAKGTVEQAFRELVREGLIYSVDRKGMFLAKDPPAAAADCTTVGLVLQYGRYEQEDNPFYRAIYEGAEREAAGRRHNVLSLWGWGRKGPLEKDREVAQFREGLAGFLALATYDDRDCLRLRDSGRPVAAVDCETLELGIDCAVIDNPAVMGALCARVLAERPAEALLVDLRRKSDYDPAVAERHAAFRKTMADAGRQAGDDRFVLLPPTGPAGAEIEAVRRAVTAAPGHTALVCCDEFATALLLRLLGADGPRPGRDFRLAYLGSREPGHADVRPWPALIGAVDFRELGRAGMLLLEERIAAGPGRAVRRTGPGAVVEWPGEGGGS